MIDLTEAVEAAARAAAEHRAFVGNARPNDGMSMWDSLQPDVQHLLRELVLPLVTAAAPLIATSKDTMIERLRAELFPGTPCIVGERGPELFTPDQPGMIAGKP